MLRCATCKKTAKQKDPTTGQVFCESNSCHAEYINAKSDTMNELNQFFYDTFNGERDITAESRLSGSMYGEYEAFSMTTELRYDELVANIKGIDVNSVSGKSFKHQDGYTHEIFEMHQTVFQPKDHNERDIATLFCTNGVPVNASEWFDVARLLGRFIRVVCIDLFGMGKSSMPLDFKDNDDNWLWSWLTHAHIFKMMFDDYKKQNRPFFIDEKVIFAANDWGAGALQKFMEMFPEMVLGAAPCSAIALDGYWVQHIGALNALASLTYPSPTFDVEAIRFAGVLTSLLETMFHRTSEIHNQYTMAHLQEPYVEITYSDPEKNPANTKYKSHAIRVLAEQASVILGNGELLPKSEQSPNGIDFTKWMGHVLMIWGRRDKMMPEGQVFRFKTMINHINYERKILGETPTVSFDYKRLENAGHFAVSDQPEESAEILLSWIEKIAGIDRLANVFLGFDSIARQDEKKIITKYKNLFDK